MTKCIVNTRELLPCLREGMELYMVGPTTYDHDEYAKLELKFITRSYRNSGWNIGDSPYNGPHFLDQEVSISRAGVVCLQDQDEDWYILRLFSLWDAGNPQKDVLALISAAEHPLLCGRIPKDDEDNELNLQEIQVALRSKG